MTTRVRYPCRPPVVRLVRYQCGSDRDCADSQNFGAEPFLDMVCGTAPHVFKHPTRTAEIWNELGTRRYVRLTQSSFNRFWGSRCGDRVAVARARVTSPAPDAFTVDVPGFTDVFKLKAWESKDLRRERFQRFQTRKSPVPEALQWLPPLLTKLDNAQDLIFTVLALAIPLIKRLPARLVPGIGWLLTLNDILNLFT